MPVAATNVKVIEDNVYIDTTDLESGTHVEIIIPIGVNTEQFKSFFGQLPYIVEEALRKVVQAQLDGKF